MQLNFDSLYELAQFFDWVQGQRATAPVDVPQATIVVQDLEPAEESAEPEAEADDTPAPKPVTVRKRRTKAEMEAARAAAPDLKDEMEAARTATQDAVAGILEAAGEAPEAAKEMAALAVDLGDVPTVAVALANTPDSMQDAISFIKSRLTERPEVSQVEHLNLARTFIGKHGMEKYNTSFPLAGLTPNVMGYSPADCATHAAALDFLSLE